MTLLKECHYLCGDREVFDPSTAPPQGAVIPFHHRSHISEPHFIIPLLSPIVQADRPGHRRDAVTLQKTGKTAVDASDKLGPTENHPGDELDQRCAQTDFA